MVGRGRYRRDDPKAAGVRRGRRRLPLRSRIDTADAGLCDRCSSFAQAGEPAGQCSIYHRPRGCRPGVRRISVGGTLARTAWAGFLQAEEIRRRGTFSDSKDLRCRRTVLLSISMCRPHRRIHNVRRSDAESSSAEPRVVNDRPAARCEEPAAPSDDRRAELGKLGSCYRTNQSPQRYRGGVGAPVREGVAASPTTAGRGRVAGLRWRNERTLTSFGADAASSQQQPGRWALAL